MVLSACYEELPVEIRTLDFLWEMAWRCLWGPVCWKAMLTLRGILISVSDFHLLCIFCDEVRTKGLKERGVKSINMVESHSQKLDVCIIPQYLWRWRENGALDIGTGLNVLSGTETLTHIPMFLRTFTESLSHDCFSQSKISISMILIESMTASCW